ncbi:hypothetical protein [Catellatospora sp. NPDC049609]|uniref:WD40/YVTN/BNR-like repeat-containing protein n=1 Tax=Catellatospora sp. NPDC049609 TaxID=3155505 RepID=UPI0034250177
MSDREFPGFAVDTVADAVRQPPLDDLWATARDRRRRRRATVLAAMAVIVVVASAAIPLGGGPGRFEFAAPRPTDAPFGRTASDLVVLSDVAAVVVEVAEHGCKISFAATGDGGRQWSPWRSVRPGTGCTTTADTGYTVLSHRSYLVRFGDESLLSTDAGQTWQDAASAVTAVTAFPPRTRPVSCQTDCRPMQRPMAVDPASGRVYRLSGEAPSPFAPTSIHPTPDGALWVVYPGGGFTRPDLIARSIDRGATWQTSHAPEATVTIGVAAVDGKEAYLLTEPLRAGADSPPAEGTAGLRHTTDGGKSWVDVPTDLRSNNVIRPIVVGSDGSLMVVDFRDSIAELLISRDGGRHFGTARRYGHDSVLHAGPGLVWYYESNGQSLLGTDRIEFTTDGQTWSRFRLPD